MPIINISLQIISSATGTQGKAMQLEPNQIVSFGKTKAADIVLPEDDQLQSRHFSIRSNNGECQLTLLTAWLRCI
jgi:hypothetical protein